MLISSRILINFMPDILLLIIIGYAVLELANGLASLSSHILNILLILEVLISVCKIILYGRHN